MNEDTRRHYYWIHRYLRLHSELLEDDIYRELYDMARHMRIVRHKNKFGWKDEDEKAIGEVLDMSADFLNKESPDEVKKWKPIVRIFYEGIKQERKEKRRKTTKTGEIK